LVVVACVAAACGSPTPPAASGSARTTTAPGAAGPGAAGTTTAPTATQMVDFNPFDSGGPLRSITVTFRTTGFCDRQSVADPGRSGAYLCTLDRAAPDGDKSADPCFNDPFGTQSSPLLCLVSPFTLRAVEVTPDDPLVSPNEPSGDPWALRLANGQRCVYAPDSPTVRNGVRLTYRCGNDAVVYGDPDSSPSFWTVSYAPSQAGAPTIVQVETAWY